MNKTKQNEEAHQRRRYGGDSGGGGGGGGDISRVATFMPAKKHSHTAAEDVEFSALFFNQIAAFFTKRSTRITWVFPNFTLFLHSFHF